MKGEHSLTTATHSNLVPPEAVSLAPCPCSRPCSLRPWVSWNMEGRAVHLPGSSPSGSYGLDTTFRDTAKCESDLLRECPWAAKDVSDESSERVDSKLNKQTNE